MPSSVLFSLFFLVSVSAVFLLAFLRSPLATPRLWVIFCSMFVPIARADLAFNDAQRDDSFVEPIFQPGQLVRVNLAGLDAGGVSFQAAVTDAVAHIIKQTSDQPPKYLVELLFSFRGVSQLEVPANRIHAGK